MTGQCCDCKFWGKETYQPYQDTVWEGLRHCEAIVESWDDTANERRAVVEDGSYYMAKLLCRGDFGCVEFQPRPDSSPLLKDTGEDQLL